MSLKNRIITLAKNRNMSLKAVETALGFGNGTINKWDRNTPNAEKLSLVADYFDVSMEYLLTGIDKDGLSDKDNKDIAKDLRSLQKKLSNHENGPARYEGTDIEDEDIDLFLGQVEIMLRRLKAINKEKYNPNKYKK